MTCAHYACTRYEYLHGVCMDHLISTLEAGRRASPGRLRRMSGSHASSQR